MNAHEYDAAEQILIQTIETYPNFSEAWNRRATLYFMMNRFSDSLVDIGHVLDLEPRHFGALAGKGAVLKAMGKNIEALAALREALAIDPHMESVAATVKEMEKAEPGI